MSLAPNIKSSFSNTRGWFILCLCSIAIGLSISKPLMSLGLFGLLIVWLVDGNPKAKIKAYWNNKTAVIISSIYLITVLGLIHTSNFEFALDDLRRKLPIFFIPFYVAGFSPITTKELQLLLKVFIGGVLIATLWSLFVYLGGLNETIVDVRDYSRFNSHIRFGLEVALAIFICFHFAFNAGSLKQKLAWASFSVWLIATLFLFSLFTGLIVFVATASVILVVFGALSNNQKLKWTSILLASFISIGCIFYLVTTINNFNKSITPKKIEAKLFSKAGNKYQIDSHTKNSTLRENGYHVEKHIAWREFEAAWNTRSNISFNDKDLKGQDLKSTLTRFITSKGQRKDKESIDMLSDYEVKAIERGVSNYLYLEMNPVTLKLHKILWEHNNSLNGGNINGHSVLMRWEYWKTALSIIKKHLFFGVGTGDVQDAFDQHYKESNSILTAQYRLRTHNQFLAFGVSFGLVGFCWFIGCLFYTALLTINFKNYLYLAFFGIITSSMFTEDTLEIQAGINLFAFFNTLLLLSTNTKTENIK